MNEHELERLLQDADAPARAPFDAVAVAASARRTVREHQHAVRRNVATALSLLIVVGTSAIVFVQSRPVAQMQATRGVVRPVVNMRLEADEFEREAQAREAVVRAVSRQRSAIPRRTDTTLTLSTQREQAAAVLMKSVASIRDDQL